MGSLPQEDDASVGISLEQGAEIEGMVRIGQLLTASPYPACRFVGAVRLEL